MAKRFILLASVSHPFAFIHRAGRKMPLRVSEEHFFSGDGRTRTAVQTPYPIAFYTFILPLIVGNGMPEDGLVRNLSSESWRALKESTRASGLDDTPYAMKDRPES